MENDQKPDLSETEATATGPDQVASVNAVNPDPVNAAAASDATNAIDALLAVEDPAFEASMAELKTLGPSVGTVDEIEPIELEEKAGLSKAIQPQPAFMIRVLRSPLTATMGVLQFLKQLSSRSGKPSLKVLLKEFFHFSAAQAKSFVRSGLASVKRALAHFLELSLFGKLRAAFVAVLLLAMILVLRATWRGELLPSLQSTFLNEFKSKADASFEYDPGEKMEEFQNPLLHPETVVMMDRMVVNLKPVKPDSNPMAMLEFYIETDNRDAAIELKDRQVEARDLISRTVEQISYEELVTDQGKYKLKAILRRNLDELLTKGRARRIFFKSMVLKP